MNAQDADFLRSKTKRLGDAHREPQYLSERKEEFQSALETYLSGYRLAMDAHRCRAAYAPRSALQRCKEWFRRKSSVANENTHNHFNYRRPERIDCL